MNVFDLKNLGIEEIDDEKIQKFLEQNIKFQNLMLQYNCALMETITKFNVLNAEFSMRNDRNPIESIKTRIKSPASIVAKMKSKNIPLTFEDMEKSILDIAGIRVVCSFEEDVYFLCDCITKQNDVEVIIKKDYIKTPKSNGYRSLHVTIKTPIYLANEVKYVPVEIQLRTIAMDFWASLEHKIRYKKNLAEDEFVSKELLDCAVSSKNWDKKMANLMTILHS